MILSELRQNLPKELPRFREDDPNDREFVPADPLATWWIQRTPGTTYWRALVPAKALPGKALILKYDDLVEVGDDVVVPRNVGTSIWQFVGNATRALIMAELQRQGTKVLMEVDDNYLKPPPRIPHGDTSWTSKLDRTENDRYSFQAHRKICQWVDGIICSTEPLAEQYERATNVPVYHCPNSVDLDDWPMVSLKGDGPRAIGYAGSASHIYDMSLIRRALDYAWRQDDVEIWKLGIGMETWNFPHKGIRWTDNLADYRKNLQVLDVGLCPLKRSDWHDAKSDIKAMEYILAGAVPIVQYDSPVYKDWVGIVPSASTEKEWLKAIKWACHAPQEELLDVYQKASDFLLEKKLIAGHVERWREAIA